MTVGTAGYSIGGNFVFTGSSNLNSGTANVVLTATPQITVSNNTLTVAGIISGSAFGITKAGSGTLALSGTNTYGGATVINNGSSNAAQVVTADTAVTLALKTGTSTLAGTVSGTIPAGYSLVTITGVTYTKAESGVALTASCGSLTAGDSAPFTVNAGAAATVSSTSGDSQSATVGTALGNPFVVTVTDSTGNPIPGTSVTFAVATTPAGAAGQALSVITTTSDNTGQAASTLSLGNLEGTYTVTATSGSLSGSPLTFTVTGTPAGAPDAVNSTVAASPSSVSADGASASTITVTLKDASNHPIPGKTVTLVSNRGSVTDTISAASSASTVAGVVTFTVKSATLGSAILSATDTTDGVPVSQTATLAFTTLIVGAEQYNPGAPPSPIGVTSPDLLEMAGVVATGEIKPARWHNGDFDDANELGYGDSPYVITYALDLAVNPPGYDIKEIRVFSKHDSLRSSQSYDTWKNSTFAHAFADKDPTHNPDGDGLINQQEFAFGLDPTTGASADPITRQPDPATGTFQYTRWADSGLDYTVEYSTDLTTWEAAASTEFIGEPDSHGVQTVTVTVTNTPVGGKLFVRVKAQ